MKFSAATLLALAATPCSEAFLPSKVATAFHVAPRTFALHSTTEDDLDVEIALALKNNVEAANGLIEAATAPKSSQQESTRSEWATAAETRAAAAAYVSQYEGQSGAAIIYSKLVEHGVTVVNGFSGGAVLPLLDQFHEDHPRHGGQTPAIRWITNSNEQSAGHIAEGYGKSQPLHQKHLPVGVVVATSGPGLTNLITPLQDAICDGVPVVALCGQAATVAPPDAFQSAPAVELTTPCTKWSYQIRSAAELPMVLDYAFYVARNGRPGPVFVDLPKDLQNQILTSDLIDEFVERNLSENAHDTSSFVRMGADGNLQVGTNGKTLPFTIAKIYQAQQLHHHMEICSDCFAADDHFADHRPTNTIYKNDPDGTVIEEGPLSNGSNAALMQEILGLVRHARKPVILAGQGCNDAAAELQEFASTLQIPVATTLHALGCFDERQDLALNMVGMHGHPTPNFLFQEADLVICVGSRFDDRITGRMSDYIPAAKEAAEEGRGGVIHVDIRRTEKAKQLTPTFFVHSTGKQFLQTMNAALAAAAPPRTVTAAWLERMKELQEQFPVKIPKFPTEHVTVTADDGKETVVARTRLSVQSAVAELNRQLLAADKMDDAIFTTGVGVHQMVTAQLITWTQPRQMLSSGSLGTMGVALGYSIGAQLANPTKMVIAVDGDGSFNMTFTELKTLIEQRIPVKIMVIDNNGQMMVEYWQRLFHDNRLLAVRNSANPDYSTLAAAFGIKSIYCDAEQDLPAAMHDFLFGSPGEPVLFHVRVERTPCLPLVAPGQPLDDMILEDVEVDVDGSAAPS